MHQTSGGALPASDLAAFGAKLKTLPGVGAVAPPTLSTGRATAAYTVTLSFNPQSTAAVNLVKNQLRPAVHAAAPPGTAALVGGTTAVFADIQRAVNHDYAVVFPVAALIILVILGLLLRSVVAPWYLLASVVLGFGATLGASVLVFQVAGGQPGLVFLLPVYMYLFVVALGTDYNILMIARLREEAKRRPATAAGRRHRVPARGPNDRGGRADPGRHVRLADPGREHHLVPARLRRLRRDRAGRVRHGHVLLPQPHHPHRPLGLVARPRRPAPRGGRATAPGGPPLTGGPETRPPRPARQSPGRPAAGQLLKVARWRH